MYGELRAVVRGEALRETEVVEALGELAAAHGLSFELLGYQGDTWEHAPDGLSETDFRQLLTAEPDKYQKSLTSRAFRVAVNHAKSEGKLLRNEQGELIIPRVVIEGLVHNVERGGKSPINMGPATFDLIKSLLNHTSPAESITEPLSA